MNSLRVASTVVLVCALCSSCAQRAPDRGVIVRIVVDPSNAIGKRLDRATYRFSLAMQEKSPHERIHLAFFSVRSYPEVLQLLSTRAHPQIVVLNRETDKSDIGEVAQRLGDSELVCGLPTYIPDWTSPEDRKGAQAFLQTLKADCEAAAPPHR